MISNFLCLLLLLLPSDITDRSNKKIVEAVVKGPIGSSVQERGLVRRDVKSANEVIQHHSAFSDDTSSRRFDGGHVLGYVTPWNRLGYEVAKKFGSKFSSVSPVWLQLVPRRRRAPSGGPFEVVGGHDVDVAWMREVRRGGDVKIVPRILFDKWSGRDYHDLFADPSLVASVVQLIVDAVAVHDFDGVVLEVWIQLGGQARSHLAEVVKAIGGKLMADGKLFVLAVPPPVHAGNVEGMFDANDLAGLVDFVDYFSLMTYDYSSAQRPGPNAHMEWVERCVELLDPNASHRAKILLGLNFYGNDYTVNGGGPIVGTDFIALLERSLKEEKEKKNVPSFKWDDRSQEHFIELRLGADKGKHIVFFPSLLSIQSRLLAAKRMNLGGVAIWELGQGLDYFYDLL